MTDETPKDMGNKIFLVLSGAEFRTLNVSIRLMILVWMYLIKQSLLEN